MPVIPTRSPVPSVGTAPLPGVRLPTGAPREAFGGVAPPDFSGVQQEIAGIYQREKQKANQIAVNDADNQASSLRDQVLYGTDDNPGILMKRGKDAMAGLDDALTQWKKGVSDITDSLAGDDQKIAFYQRIDGYDHNLHEQIQAHVAAEHRRFDDETTDSYVANRVNDASTSFANPQAVDDNIAKANAMWTDYARRSGKSAEWLQEQQQKTTSAARLSVVQQMLVANEAQGGGDLRASAYLAQHRAEFTARDLAEADRLTEAGSVEGESQRVVDGILKSSVSLSDAQQKIGAQVTDPKVRVAAERRARQAYADEAASDRDMRNAAFNRSSQLVMGGGTVDQIPLPDRVLLSPNEFDELDRTAQRIRNPVVVTPPSYFQHWMNNASLSPQTQQEFLDHDFGADRAAGKVSEADFHHFTGLQLQLRNSGVRGEQRDERAAAAQETRHQRSEETATIKALRAYDKSKAARASMDTVAGLAKYLAPLTPPSIPQWMADSAANDPHYMDYLKFNGYNPVQASPKPQALPTQKVPGAPITP
jgi:hypothetical protein